MQNSVETLTKAIAMLGMFQVSPIGFGATLIPTPDVCSKREI